MSRSPWRGTPDFSSCEPCPEGRVRELRTSEKHRKIMGKHRNVAENDEKPWVSYCDDYLRIGLWMSMGKSWNILRQVDRKIRREIHRCFELCFDGKNPRCLTLFPWINPSSDTLQPQLFAGNFLISCLMLKWRQDVEAEVCPVGTGNVSQGTICQTPSAVIWSSLGSIGK